MMKLIGDFSVYKCDKCNYEMIVESCKFLQNKGCPRCKRIKKDDIKEICKEWLDKFIDDFGIIIFHAEKIIDWYNENIDKIGTVWDKISLDEKKGILFEYWEREGFNTEFFIEFNTLLHPEKYKKKLLEEKKEKEETARLKEINFHKQEEIKQRQIYEELKKKFEPIKTKLEEKLKSEKE